MLSQISALIGGDFGIFQTVAKLKGLILEAINDPQARIRLRAESLLKYTLERDEVAEVQSLFRFVQNRLHYVNDPEGTELLKNPMYLDDQVRAEGSFMGDCDDASGYLAALLKSVGYNVNLVIVTPDNAPGFDYRHIFVRAYLPRHDQWVNLDATAKGKPFGWQVPNKKEREFPV